MADCLWSIREICAEFGATARTLRFYEAKALLFPIRRGQRRLFTPRCRRRLALILRGRRIGLSLEEIRGLLGLYDFDECQAAQRVHQRELAQEYLAAMEERRAEIDAMIIELRLRLAETEGPRAPRDSGLAAE